MVNGRRKGRQKEIRKLRVQYWVSEVLRVSKKSLMELEQKFSAKDKAAPRSCIWDKYLRGEVLPRIGKPNIGKPSVLDEVEGVYKNTKQLFTSDLWRLMDDDAIVEMTEIRRILRELPSPLCDHIFLRSSEWKDHDGFWRRHGRDKTVGAALLETPSFPNLLFAVALKREAEIAQDLERFRYWRSVAKQLEESVLKSAIALHIGDDERQRRDRRRRRRRLTAARGLIAETSRSRGA